MQSSSQSSVSVGIQLCLWLTVVLWSSALVAIRIGLHGFSPGALAALRYIVASLCLLLVYFKLPVRHKLPPKDLLRIFLIGVLGIGVYNLVINYGEMVVPAGIAGFIIGLMPVFTIGFAFWLLNERAPVKSWIGVFISLFGLCLIAYSEHNQFKYDLGLVFILIAAVLGSYYAVAQKTFFHRYHPLELVILSIWSGTLLMLVYLPELLRELPTAPWQSTTAAIYLGIFPAAFAYALWNYALAKAPAGRAAGYLYAMPLIATLLGAVILHEYPKPIELTGGLITLLGAMSIQYFYKQKDKAQSSSAVTNTES